MAAILLPTILGSITSIISGLFSMKQTQGNIALTAVETIGKVAAGAAAETAANASIIQAEAASPHWLPSNIRPLILLVLMGLIVSFWFGYIPPHFNDPMSPMMMEVFSLLKIGFGGYIGGRTIEKVASILNAGKMAQTFINKKIL